MKMNLTAAVLAAAIGLVAASPVHAADSLRTRAEHAYDPVRTKVEVTMLPSEKNDLYTDTYIPVRDIFASHADSVVWNNKMKTVLITKNGKSAILNFSGKRISADRNEIVLPSTWTKIDNGKTTINAYVFCYLFERYSEAYADAERDAWQNKLNFLGIEQTEGIPGVRDGIMHVYVTFNETKS